MKIQNIQMVTNIQDMKIELGTTWKLKNKIENLALEDQRF